MCSECGPVCWGVSVAEHELDSEQEVEEQGGGGKLEGGREQA